MKYQILERLLEEKKSGIKGGIYNKTQVDMAYDTNRIEGSTLTHEQTRYIYETHSFLAEENSKINADDIIETLNHFKAFNYMLDIAKEPLTETIIKKFHEIVKGGTLDEQRGFAIGDYKRYPNEIGVAGVQTVPPKEVKGKIEELLLWYRSIEKKSIDDIIQFHKRFEDIHPFQDGNGRVGRLIMFKECLNNDIVPFIIDSNHKLYYYRGLSGYEKDKTQLTETCLSAQDKYIAYCEYFEIPNVEKTKKSHKRLR